MKTTIRFLAALAALSLAGFSYAGSNKQDEKKECCGCAECKECKSGKCCCAPEKSADHKDKKEQKGTEKPKDAGKK